MAVTLWRVSEDVQWKRLRGLAAAMGKRKSASSFQTAVKRGKDTHEVTTWCGYDAATAQRYHCETRVDGSAESVAAPSLPPPAAGADGAGVNLKHLQVWTGVGGGAGQGEFEWRRPRQEAAHNPEACA